MGKKFMPQKVRRPREELHQAVDQIEVGLGLIVAGSWRREKDNIGDLDILVPPDQDFGETEEKFMTLFGYEPIRHGSMKAEGICAYHGSPLLINLWRVPEIKAWGGMLLFATGPFDLNIMMRANAKGRNWTLSQYGLFFENGEQVDYVEGDNFDQAEERIFNNLALKYLTPVQREYWRQHLVTKPPKTTDLLRIDSSDGVSYYHVELQDGKAIDCECKGFQYRHKCRHLAEAEEQWRRK